jgi:hypothetical protein
METPGTALVRSSRRLERRLTPDPRGFYNFLGIRLADTTLKNRIVYARRGARFSRAERAAKNATDPSEPDLDNASGGKRTRKLYYCYAVNPHR